MNPENIKFNILGTRDEEVNKILAETSHGKSVMMKVAQKANFHKRVAKLAKGLEIISASVFFTSLTIGAAVLTTKIDPNSQIIPGSPNSMGTSAPIDAVMNMGMPGAILAAGISIGGLATLASKMTKQFSEKRKDGQKVVDHFRNAMLDEQDKILKNNGKQTGHFNLKQIDDKLSSIVQNAQNFTDNLKQIQKNKDQVITL